MLATDLFCGCAHPLNIVYHASGMEEANYLAIKMDPRGKPLRKAVVQNQQAGLEATGSQSSASLLKQEIC
jgi:hypothetical protein